MNRTVEPIPGSRFKKGIFDMQGTSERDVYSQFFPLEMPPDHHLVHEWDASGMRLSIWPEPNEGFKPPVDAPSALVSKRRAELNLWSMEDLRTKAAEMDIPVPKGMTAPQIVAKILAKEGAKKEAVNV